MDIKKSYHCSPDCLREHWAFHRDFHTQSRENGGWWCGLHMQPQRAPTPIGLVSKCSAWKTAAARPPNHGRHFARHALILLFIDRAGVLPRAGLLQGLLHLQQQRSTHSFLPLLLPSLQARASPSPASTPSRAPTPTATALHPLIPTFTAPLLAGESQPFPRVDSFKGSYTYSNSGETWVEVGRERVYTPAPDDVGAILKFECTAYDAGGFAFSL